MRDLKISLCQYSIKWESPSENSQKLFSALSGYFSSSLRDDFRPDIVVFPEMFLTGFTMNREMGEESDGISLNWMKMVAGKFGVAIAGSLPVRDNNKYFNRMFFVFPGGEESHYDKKHLFEMGKENEIYSPGNEFVIVDFKGWNIALNICYDLRFPVWSRNQGMKYDLMMNVASWPESRIGITEFLTKARAVENISYYAFANRTGDDPSNSYCGGSRIVSPRGEDIAFQEKIDDVVFFNGVLSYEKLISLREKFPVWKNFDKFIINF
jgi:omega-amidase